MYQPKVFFSQPHRNCPLVFCVRFLANMPSFQAKGDIMVNNGLSETELIRWKWNGLDRYPHELLTITPRGLLCFSFVICTEDLRPCELSPRSKQPTKDAASLSGLHVTLWMMYMLIMGRRLKCSTAHRPKVLGHKHVQQHSQALTKWQVKKNVFFTYIHHSSKNTTGWPSGRPPNSARDLQSHRNCQRVISSSIWPTGGEHRTNNPTHPHSTFFRMNHLPCAESGIWLKPISIWLQPQLVFFSSVRAAPLCSFCTKTFGLPAVILLRRIFLFFCFLFFQPTKRH